jgi:hypothetical protein
MFRVGLRPFYRHLAARLLLCLLFPLVLCRHGFIVRPACVIQGHFVNSSMKQSLQRGNLRVCVIQCLWRIQSPGCESSQRATGSPLYSRLYRVTTKIATQSSATIPTTKLIID